MDRKRFRLMSSTKDAVEFLFRAMDGRPLLPLALPLLLFVWAIERWLLPFSNWASLAFAVWATIQYKSYQQRLLAEDLDRRWKQLILSKSPTTPLEPCLWFNKMLIEVWPNYLEPRISQKFSSIVERRLRNRKPKLMERVELLEFSLGSCPPTLGQHGVHWMMNGGQQQFMKMGFEWSTNDPSVMLLAKLAKPLMGTVRIVINSLYIKGDIHLTPILDGQAVLYSFESTPELRIGIAFGSGGSHALPGTELPGVSSWLVKLFTETLVRMMVEPRRACYSLPKVDLRKKAVGAVISVSVVSGSKLSCKGKNNGEAQSFAKTILQTFVEVEVGDLTRKTKISQGSSPKWDAIFNMTLHGESGTLKFHLYGWDPSSVKFDYLTSCEIKIKYVADGTTVFWAIGPGSSVIAKHAESCGKEVEMVIPFEETNSGELAVKLVVKEWQFSDSVVRPEKTSGVQSRPPNHTSHQVQQKTGRKIKVTLVEGRNLGTEKPGKCDPYVKLQYGKVLERTRTVAHTTDPVWNQKFEFDEIVGEYLKIKCLSADLFGDDNIGSARVNLEGISEGFCKDVWIPLEKVNSGELRVQIEAMKSEVNEEGPRKSVGRSGSGWIELFLIEARDLIAADLRGTSDPYVRVQYGNTKRRTKVVYKTLNPEWNQTFEFPYTGGPLILHVKDHNAVLPTSSIGDCVVEYERLPPNTTSDKWIPLQGVKSGEIHVRITRKDPELQRTPSVGPDVSSALSQANQISGQVRELLKKLQGFVEDGDLEALSLALSEIENVEDTQEEYMLQLEKERALLLDKIRDLGHEMSRTSSGPTKIPY